MISNGYLHLRKLQCSGIAILHGDPLKEPRNVDQSTKMISDKGIERGQYIGTHSHLFAMVIFFLGKNLTLVGFCDSIALQLLELLRFTATVLDTVPKQIKTVNHRVCYR